MKTAVRKDLPSIILLTSSFLSTALEISLIFIELSIQPQIGVHFRVGHSWRDYIYSPTTLYDGEKPYAIFSLISVLAVKPSPILPDERARVFGTVIFGQYRILSPLFLLLI